MPDYTTTAAVAQVLPDADTTDTGVAATIAALITRASAAADRYVGASFPAAVTAEARTFYGRGTHLLALDYADASPTLVTMPTGATLPAYVVRRDTTGGTLYLVTTDSEGRLSSPTRCHAVWPEGTPVAVTCAWGWAAVPGDLEEAVIVAVTARWRETYAASEPQWRSDVGLKFELPKNAKDILDRWLGRRQFGFTG